MSGLSPCPFCGSSEIRHMSQSPIHGAKCDFHWALCDDCNASTSVCKSKELAAELWNRRAEPSAQGQAVEWTQEPVEVGEFYFLHDPNADYPVIADRLFRGDVPTAGVMRSKHPLAFYVPPPPAAPQPAEPAAEGVE